jgi:hypothetical protein
MSCELSVITNEGHAAMQHTKNCSVLNTHFHKIKVCEFMLVKSTRAFGKANLRIFDEKKYATKNPAEAGFDIESIR